MIVISGDERIWLRNGIAAFPSVWMSIAYVILDYVVIDIMLITHSWYLCILGVHFVENPILDPIS